MTQPNIWTAFTLDSDLEKSGTWLNYYDAQILVARSGGANKAFNTYTRQALKPFKRQLDINPEAVEEQVVEVMKVAYAKHIVKGWENMPNPDNHTEVWPFTPENVVELFTRLPVIFEDIQELAGDWKNFAQAEREEDAKD